jgi:hypothetical protein
MWTQIDISPAVTIPLAIVATFAAILALPKSRVRTSLAVVVVCVALWGAIILLLKLKEFPSHAEEERHGDASGSGASKATSGSPETVKQATPSSLTAAVIAPITPTTERKSSAQGEPLRISTTTAAAAGIVVHSTASTGGPVITVPAPRERHRLSDVPVLHERSDVIVVPVPREITSGPFIVRISDCAISSGFLNCMMTVTAEYAPGSFGVWCSSKDPSAWSYVRIAKKQYGPAELRLLDNFPVVMDVDGTGTFKLNWSCGGVINLVPGNVAHIAVRFPNIPPVATSIDEMFFQSNNYFEYRLDLPLESAPLRFKNLLIR